MLKKESIRGSFYFAPKNRHELKIERSVKMDKWIMSADKFFVSITRANLVPFIEFMYGEGDSA
jgi:hypothetical protein